MHTWSFRSGKKERVQCRPVKNGRLSFLHALRQRHLERGVLKRTRVTVFNHHSWVMPENPEGQFSTTKEQFWRSYGVPNPKWGNSSSPSVSSMHALHPAVSYVGSDGRAGRKFERLPSLSRVSAQCTSAFSSNDLENRPCTRLQILRFIAWAVLPVSVPSIQHNCNCLQCRELR